jgi:hypothetical protein
VISLALALALRCEDVINVILALVALMAVRRVIDVMALVAVTLVTLISVDLTYLGPVTAEAQDLEIW